MRVPWNFSDSRRTNLSLDDFLAAKEAAGVTFFNGKEPWMKGVNKLTWQTFFRVCTQEMDLRCAAPSMASVEPQP
jgi:hypothetical protein